MSMVKRLQQRPLPALEIRPANLSNKTTLQIHLNVAPHRLTTRSTFSVRVQPDIKTHANPVTLSTLFQARSQSFFLPPLDCSITDMAHMHTPVLFTSEIKVRYSQVLYKAFPPTARLTAQNDAAQPRPDSIPHRMLRSIAVPLWLTQRYVGFTPQSSPSSVYTRCSLLLPLSLVFSSYICSLILPCCRCLVASQPSIPLLHFLSFLGHCCAVCRSFFHLLERHSPLCGFQSLQVVYGTSTKPTT